MHACMHACMHTCIHVFRAPSFSFMPEVSQLKQQKPEVEGPIHETCSHTNKSATDYVGFQLGALVGHFEKIQKTPLPDLHAAYILWVAPKPEGL